jgi:hypothetical protein
MVPDGFATHNPVGLRATGVVDFDQETGASMPLSYATQLSAGTYQFGVLPWGDDVRSGVDFGGRCAFTVTVHPLPGASLVGRSRL